MGGSGEKVPMLSRVRGRYTLRGDKMVDGVDYDKHSIYSPVASKAAVLAQLSIVCQYGLYLSCIDVRKAFASGDLEPGREVWMQVPLGLREKHPKYCPYGKHTMYSVRACLYGMPQSAARYWDKASRALLAAGFKMSDACSCTFRRGDLDSDSYCLVTLWVDDNIIAYKSESDFQHLRQALVDGGLGDYTIERSVGKLLGMEVSYDRLNNRLELSHESGIAQMVRDHDLGNDPPRSVPVPEALAKSLDRTDCPELQDYCHARYKRFRSLLGSISHYTNWTFPECAFVVSLASSYASNPGPIDRIAGGRVCGTVHA